jgi:heat shock protein HslJ
VGTVPEVEAYPIDDGGVTPEERVEPEIVGITWLWERFDDTAGVNNIVVENPGRYTLLLNPDGTYAVKADCNLANGSYTLGVSSITFEPGPATLAECEPGSLYDTYLTRLSEVATFVMHEGQLFLNLWADGGNLVFSQAE